MLEALLTQKVVGAVVRHLVSAAGVWMASQGFDADGATLEAISGGLVSAIMLGWSVVGKVKA